MYVKQVQCQMGSKQKLFQGEMHKLIGLLDMRSMVITVPECNGPTRTMSNGSAVTCLIIVSYGTYIGSMPHNL